MSFEKNFTDMCLNNWSSSFYWPQPKGFYVIEMLEMIFYIYAALLRSTLEIVCRKIANKSYYFHNLCIILEVLLSLISNMKRKNYLRLFFDPVHQPVYSENRQMQRETLKYLSITGKCSYTDDPKTQNCIGALIGIGNSFANKSCICTN